MTWDMWIGMIIGSTLTTIGYLVAQELEFREII
jgi:hypothetical protein